MLLKGRDDQQKVQDSTRVCFERLRLKLLDLAHSCATNGYYALMTE
jgi:hypothetical protein